MKKKYIFLIFLIFICQCCIKPEALSISNISIIPDESTGQNIDITFQTNIEAIYTITYNKQGSTGDPKQVSSTSYKTSHSVKLTGLTSCNTYELTIKVEDKNANSTNSEKLISFTNLQESTGWYDCFIEYPDNPVYDPDPYNTGIRAYYSNVQYDINHFGNAVSDYINGVSGDIYGTIPYYKMYVGDGTNTDFSYSKDGINWYYPSTGEDIVTGYHTTVIYSENTFGTDTIEDNTIKYRLWTWDSTKTYLTYYESINGIDFTYYSEGDIDNTLGSGSSVVYSISIIYKDTNSPKYQAWIDNNGDLYYITSNDGITWTSQGEITHSGKDGSSPGTRFYTGGACSVSIMDDKYIMWYSSDTTGVGTSNYNQGISYAESDDGLIWELVEILPNIGINASPSGPKQNAILHINDGNAWRESRTYCPMVIYDANKFSGNGEYKDFKMWFTGDGATYGRRIAYLSFNR